MSTVTKILNREIRSSSIQTLVGLAKGLGIAETAVFRAARGLPPTAPDDRLELLAESFDARELTPVEWAEIETVVKVLIEQKKAMHRPPNGNDSPAFRRGTKK